MRHKNMIRVTARAVLGQQVVVKSRTERESRTSFDEYKRWLRGHNSELSLLFRKDSVEFPSGGKITFVSAEHTLDGVKPENVIYDELEL